MFIQQNLVKVATGVTCLSCQKQRRASGSRSWTLPRRSSSSAPRSPSWEAASCMTCKPPLQSWSQHGVNQTKHFWCIFIFLVGIVSWIDENNGSEWIVWSNIWFNFLQVQATQCLLALIVNCMFGYENKENICKMNPRGKSMLAEGKTI